MRRIGLGLTLLALLCSGCPKSERGTYEGGTYRGKDAQFTHGQLPENWQPTQVAGLDVAFYHPAYGATVGVSTICEDVDETSLEGLAQQELVGIEKRAFLEQGHLDVDGRQAVEWVVGGTVDGVEIRLNLVVLRKGKCVYDLNLVGKPATFELARADFRGFVGGFKVVGE